MADFEARQIDGDAIVARMTEAEKDAMLKRWGLNKPLPEPYFGDSVNPLEALKPLDRPYTHSLWANLD